MSCLLATRLDFYFFCSFDDVALPDHSTLCRFRNWLAQDGTLAGHPGLINRQLTEKGLKIEKAPAAVIDATIIQTASGKQRQAVETDENGVTAETLPSKDKDTRWVKKDGKFTLGYKQHTRTDSEGYIEKLHITPASVHECNHFEPLLAGLAPETTVYADKGYDSKANREHLQSKRLSDGIMRRAHWGKPLTEQEKQRIRSYRKCVMWSSKPSVRCTGSSAVKERTCWFTESTGAKPFESGVPEPAKGSQQASCACCCLKEKAISPPI